MSFGCRGLVVLINSTTTQTGSGYKMTDKQAAFVMHYVACLNGAEAARRAGYPAASARQIASENLSKPDIRAAIDASFAESVMPANEILARLTEQARVSVADFFTVKGRGLTLDLKKAADLGVLHLLKKYSKTKQGTLVEFYDAKAALDKLGEHHRLWVQRQELSGPGGGPIEIDDARDKLADILARRFGASDTDTDPGGDTGA